VIGYRHTQVAWGALVGLAAAVTFFVVAGTLTGTGRLGWILGVLVAGIALLFGTLTTEIENGELRCRFGVGLVRKRFRLDSIEKAETVRNRWYYGWGIRYTPHGWMFNVWGLRAVEVSFRCGRRFRIGTDEPDRLARAINERVGRSAA